MKRAQGLVALASIGLLAIAVGCAHPGAAASVPAPPQSADPPGRVARLSYLQGSVSFQAAGTDDWAPAVLNRPLTASDRLWTDSNARAELHLDAAAIRLDARTSINFLDLDDRSTQLKITEGAISVRVRRLNEDETIELDTPNAAVTLLRPGDYRLEVRPEDNSTQIIVRTGDAEVTSTSQAFTVHARQHARVAGTDSTTYEITAAAGPDGFDEFCASRDRREDRAESAKYVSPDVIGYDDLDEFGAWSVHSTWGPIWTPRGIAAGWAPYRFGHWAWIEPWGWTWIDDAPWGFAPFHYGRWIFLDAGWYWIPGPIRVRPVYAPALVVFVGGGRPGFHFSFWIGSAGVAWFPLGPREVYIPPYHASRIYVNNINITNTVIDKRVNIDRIDMSRQRYVNRTTQGAVTAVPREAFIGGRRISSSAVNISPQQAAAAEVNGTAAPVAPTRESLSPSRVQGIPTPRPPQRSETQPVVVRRTPAPAPVPFEKKQPALDARPGRPPDRGTIDGLRRGQPQAQPEVRQVPPTVRQPQPAQRPPETPRSKPEVRKEQRNDDRRTRGIQNEHRREQEAQTRKK